MVGLLEQNGRTHTVTARDHGVALGYTEAEVTNCLEREEERGRLRFNDRRNVIWLVPNNKDNNARKEEIRKYVVDLLKLEGRVRMETIRGAGFSHGYAMNEISACLAEGEEKGLMKINSQRTTVWLTPILVGKRTGPEEKWTTRGEGVKGSIPLPKPRFLTARRNPTSESGGSNGTSVCLLYTSPSPRDRQKSRMPSSA